VSELLGHSGIQIAADTYTTLFQEVDAAAAEAVAKPVPRSVRTTCAPADKPDVERPGDHPRAPSTDRMRAEGPHAARGPGRTRTDDTRGVSAATRCQQVSAPAVVSRLRRSTARAMTPRPAADGNSPAVRAHHVHTTRSIPD
jgi:hypothetical protein